MLRMAAVSLLLCRLSLAQTGAGSADSLQSLRVYAIDVEGGKATLYVAPSGESMLVDAGYAGFDGRDAKRIATAAAQAGINQIDYLVVTHYHQDHIGGVPQIAARLPIRHVVDHGRNFENVKDVGALYEAYVALRLRSDYQEVRAGDLIPIHGMRVQVVTASGEAIAKPLPGQGARNPACGEYHALDPDPGENAHSIGFILTYGDFRLVDLGDLYWNQEHDLACPDNKLGTVDVYMTTHHGTKTSGSPQMVWALRPRVAIMNNGPRKGGSPEAWQTIHDSPGLLDLWQLHYSIAGEAGHNVPEPFIANLQEKCQGDGIVLTAHRDGSFTVRNGRTGFEKAYRK